ncbi:exodeoxyribonuclease III [Saprospira grandis]|uniref:Exodeoxyribonuclease III Xth n=1 Tax=Saprospira grandis (strain Lewin) TaxID=984262 RepID=H6L6Q5_SAPGL|nr:exodeoxyribonuclease III [Saprospira grandis]AFC25301.1 exodeoxyribonuclease III Xth [Saprospira grandis str. Lewin]
MKVLSYNVNGLRAAIRKGFVDWVKENDIDIIGLQEAKALREQVDLEELQAAGYEHIYWHAAEKKGYSGVVVLSKVKADLEVQGMGIERFDKEGRVLRLDFGDWTLLNCYFPSGTSGSVRQEVKYDFLDSIYDWVQELKKERPKILLQGDYNIAHEEIDIHNPKRNHKTSGFLPEERAWMSKWLEEGGFVDSFRQLHPEEQKFSWWSMRSKTARANNKGWRIDYQCVSEDLVPAIKGAELLNDAVHSDHCPCLIELDV